jgi:hypothetical protein
MSGGCRTVPALLLSEGFLHLAEFPLNLPGRLFDFAPRLQAAIVRQLSCFLLDLALYFVNLAFGLIFGASLHHGFSLIRILYRGRAFPGLLCPFTTGSLAS